MPGSEGSTESLPHLSGVDLDPRFAAGIDDLLGGSEDESDTVCRRDLEVSFQVLRISAEVFALTEL